MEKSAVTEFFLEYFEKNRINAYEISENTGIEIEKLSVDYRQPLSAEEFLKLCCLLGVKPEEVKQAINKQSVNK